MRRISVLLLGLLLLVCAWLPASASAPVVLYQEDIDEVWNFGEFEGWFCGEYPLLDHATVHGEVIAWYDKNGDPTRMEWVATKGTDRLYTEAHPEIVLEGIFHWRSTLTDFAGYDEAGEPIFLSEKWVGMDWNFQLPGEGTVMHSVGQVRWDYSGPAPEEVKSVGLREFDLETLCRALGVEE